MPRPRSLPATIRSPPSETRPADADTVRAAIDTVLDEASGSGRRPTVTAIERRLAIPHATFHRHYADLIDTHFRPRIRAARSQKRTDRPKTDEPKEENLRRLRQENTDLRRTSPCTRRPSGNSASRTTLCAAAAPSSLCPPVAEPPRHHSHDLGPVRVAQRARTGGSA